MLPPLPKVAAFVFDNDGVTVDSEPLIFEATQRVFAEHGIQLKHADIEAGIGAGDKYVMDPLMKYGLPLRLLPVLLEKRREYFFEIMPGRLRPGKGMLDLLKELRRLDVKTALASSGATDTVMRSLQVAGVPAESFDAIVDGSAIARKKPFPDLFLKAAQMLDLPAAACMVVEDAPPGIEAAQRAGMRVVAITSSFSALRLHGAERHFDSPASLLKQLSELL